MLPPPLDPLGHRRDVASLVAFHKEQMLGVPYLDILRINPRIVDRKTVISSNELVEVSRSQSNQNQRTFVNSLSPVEHFCGSHTSCNDLPYTGCEAVGTQVARHSPHSTATNDGSGLNVIR